MWGAVKFGNAMPMEKCHVECEFAMPPNLWKATPQLGYTMEVFVSSESSAFTGVPMVAMMTIVNIRNHPENRRKLF